MGRQREERRAPAPRHLLRNEGAVPRSRFEPAYPGARAGNRGAAICLQSAQEGPQGVLPAGGRMPAALQPPHRDSGLGRPRGAHEHHGGPHDHPVCLPGALIRSRVQQRGRPSRRRLHSWSFAQLRGFLAYKAQEKGCAVVGIDPRHTSQCCSRCGHTARNNRRSPSDFTCRSCGFRLNADLNGSRNIAWKHLAGMATSDPGGPPSTGLTSADPGGQAVGFSRR